MDSILWGCKRREIWGVTNRSDSCQAVLALGHTMPNKVASQCLGAVTASIKITRRELGFGSFASSQTYTLHPLNIKEKPFSNRVCKGKMGNLG